ncbi:dickkopf-related protein 3a [Synchiropus splendidus]|uniref:dickkopf-related protein 3a n=1 Tax=Synchiropus splendidus TaxID=270530 RepID=UPI00237ECF2B|nr:dickkopf-related protein 3a [Synchiropus splendidus]
METRIFLLTLALTALCDGILPEWMQSGFHHSQESNSVPTDQIVSMNQRRESDEGQTEDEAQASATVTPSTASFTLSTSTHQEPNSTVAATEPTGELENNIDNTCDHEKDCERGTYCHSDAHKCLPCKATDVPCTKDKECCGEQLCVWGQCSENATKGEAGSTCQYQRDCREDLCCAFHKALLFPVCTPKPIERERCIDAPNHLIDLLTWEDSEEQPRKHCPCVGDLHCHHLGRGSMCLKGDDSSEEHMTEELYSDIDYIL